MIIIIIIIAIIILLTKKFINKLISVIIGVMDIKNGGLGGESVN